MNDLVLKILNSRGIKDEAEIKEFLSDKPKKTYDPFLLYGMREGVDLILSAVDSKKKITVYGDYDCDGVTSTVIVMTILRALGADPDYYIPSRFTEGYGLNKTAIKEIHERGTSLIVTVDCGSGDFEEIEYAKSLGMDILVTDHHNCDDGVADTIVINPHQKACSYPFEGLAGCGVAYKLALALRDERNISKSVTNRLLDMVALGTVADIVPLIDENRTLVKYGLRELNSKNRPGISALISLDFEGTKLIDEGVIGYGLAPRVNAAGRVEHAGCAADLFLADTGDEALPLASKLINYNSRRRKLQDETEEACLMLSDKYIGGYCFPIIETPDAHEGISGIVAGKLKDRLKRPVAIVTPFGENAKGTSRSVDKVDLHALLSEFDDLFVKFGGHRGACGFTISPGNVEALRKGVNDILSKRLEDDPDLFEPMVSYDVKARPSDIDVSLVTDMERLAPFGKDNERPLFLFENVYVKSCIFMGKEKEHMKLVISDKSGSSAEAVLFRYGAKERKIAEEALNTGKTIDLTGTLKLNVWNGNVNPQIYIERME